MLDLFQKPGVGVVSRVSLCVIVSLLVSGVTATVSAQQQPQCPPVTVDTGISKRAEG